MSQMRRVFVLFVALILAPSTSRAGSPLLDFPDDVFAHAAGEDIVDTLFFGSGRAAIVRVHIQVGGKSFPDILERLCHAALTRTSTVTTTMSSPSQRPTALP